MCDTNRLTGVRAIDAAGLARREQLKQWVAEDLARGDPTLTHALRRWRDEVVTRISVQRPQAIRIPQIFVAQLHLLGQRAVVVEGDEVLILLKHCGSKFETGASLVPRQEKVTVLVIGSACSD